MILVILYSTLTHAALTLSILLVSCSTPDSHNHCSQSYKHLRDQCSESDNLLPGRGWKPSPKTSKEWQGREGAIERKHIEIRTSVSSQMEWHLYSLSTTGPTGELFRQGGGDRSIHRERERERWRQIEGEILRHKSDGKRRRGGEMERVKPLRAWLT